MNLIANTGIQFFTVPLEINLNDNFKMYFHEWFDVKDEQLKLEIAHNFTDDEIWVSKKDIYNLLGLGLTDGKVGQNGRRMVNRIQVGRYKKMTSFQEVIRPITPMESEDGGIRLFPITNSRCRWEKFENQLVAFPILSR
jgi:hypothetical protein